MSIPSFTGLQTALSGLEAAQAAIDTTGQNIANANTPGYSRQTVDLTERNPLTVQTSTVTGQSAQLGLGVDITTISRVRDQFLDTSYRDQNTQTSGDNTASTLLGQVQAALNEPSSNGLSNALGQFWQSWNALQTEPTGSGSAGALQAVLGQGAAVAQGLNTLSQQLSSVESQVSSQFSTLTDTSSGPVASDANQIATLNVQIAQAQSAGTNANDLLDQRDNLIDDLSQYSNVYVSPQSNGMVNVYFGQSAITEASGGTSTIPALVSGSTADTTPASQNLTEANLSGSGGTLGSLLKLYDSTTGTGQVATYSSTLDGIANTLATTVNQAISTADSSGPSAPAFFTSTSGTTPITAADIEVNPAVSTTSTPYTAAEAGAVAQLSTGSANSDYNAFVTQIGGDVQTAQNAQQTSQSLLTAISQQRQSVSGVSLDEEMTNLITYQQAYQASARVMSTINDTFTALLGMLSG
jgi:flagellar hook-associated protein 1